MKEGERDEGRGGVLDGRGTSVSTARMTGTGTTVVPPEPSGTI